MALGAVFIVGRFWGGIYVDEIFGMRFGAVFIGGRFWGGIYADEIFLGGAFMVMRFLAVFIVGRFCGKSDGNRCFREFR